MASKDSSPETAESKLDDGALDAIRSILTEETKPAPRRSLSREKTAPVEQPPEVAAPPRKASFFPELESAEAASDSVTAAPKKSRRKFPLGGILKRRAAKTQKAAPVRTPQPETVASSDGIVAKVKAYRPKPAHIALGALALVVLMRPWLVLGLVVLSLLILVGVFLIAGYDGFWQGVMKLGRWYANRRPERAAVLHARLDRFAVRWDAILDRFPEGSVDALYLPDFGDLATAEDRHAEAMERRLSGLHEKGA
ncbi:hypothetical protein [Sulfitobacter sp.]|uniref:hypothetical protein n=1 Tax=Sulfitobacter sp. TaxID=1903071 RepID=UPI00300304CD